MELDNFIKTFMDNRTVYWKRKVKVDKMDEILRQMPVNVTPKNNTAPYPPSSSEQSFSPVYATIGTPYPANDPPMHSLLPTHPAPYPPSPGARRSLPTPSLQYQQQQPTPAQPPNYASIQPSQPQYSMPPSYLPQGPPGHRPSYPSQSGGYPPRPQGYPPQNSYRPPPVGGPPGAAYGGGFAYHVPHGRKY